MRRSIQTVSLSSPPLFTDLYLYVSCADFLTDNIGVLFVLDWKKRETVQIEHLHLRDTSTNLVKLLGSKIIHYWSGQARLLLIVSEQAEDGYGRYPSEYEI